jgi:5-bromo-4-chloroindolyl phosphate hydrolysis protein
MKLSSDVVTELAQLRSNIAALKKDESELTDKLKDQMIEEGLTNKEYAPQNSPYKLCLDKTKRSSVSWKWAWTQLAKKHLANYKRIQNKMIEDSKETVYALRVEPNENYKEKA